MSVSYKLLSMDQRKGSNISQVTISMSSILILISLILTLTTVVHFPLTEAKSFNLTELEGQIKSDFILKNETEALIRKILAKREELKSILVAPSNQEILQASAASQLLQQQAVAASQSQPQQVTTPIQQLASSSRQIEKQTQNFGQMMGSFMNTLGLSMRRMWDFFANALKMMRSMYSKVVG